MASRPSPVHHRHLLSRLEREWARLRVRPDAVARAAGWGLGIVVTDLDDVLAAAGLLPAGHRPARGRRTGEPAAVAVAVARADGAMPRRSLVEPPAGAAPLPAVASMAAPGAVPGDPTLRRLVAVARADDLAARCVLQRILPGLSAAARRRGGGHVGHVGALDELLAAAWCAIREFPPSRPDRHVAATLIRDCEYRAFRSGRRRLMVQEPTETDRLDIPVEHVEIEPLVELLGLLREARDKVLARDLRLLGSLLAAPSAKLAAAQLDVTPRTLRNHRDALVQRLRTAAA